MKISSLASRAKNQEFKKGDEILYVRGTDRPLEGIVQKVHLDAGDPPFYTVLINVTGMEKNTDHLHLRHKDRPVVRRVTVVCFVRVHEVVGLLGSHWRRFAKVLKIGSRGESIFIICLAWPLQGRSFTAYMASVLYPCFFFLSMLVR